LKRHVRGTAVTALMLSGAIQGLDMLLQESTREIFSTGILHFTEGSLFLATILAALLAAIPKPASRSVSLIISLGLLAGQMYLAVTRGMVVSWGAAVLLLVAVLLLFSLIRADHG